MPIENPTQPLMPFLKALRKQKLRAELFGDSARVWREKDEARQVEVYDLLQQYTVGGSALCIPAAAMVITRLTASCPRTSPKSEPADHCVT